jgi:hypothetical protein
VPTLEPSNDPTVHQSWIGTVSFFFPAFPFKS